VSHACFGQTYGDRYNFSVSGDGKCCLNISGVRESDAGLFTCIHDEAQQHIKTSFFLVVVGLRFTLSYFVIFLLQNIFCVRLTV